MSSSCSQSVLYLNYNISFNLSNIVYITHYATHFIIDYFNLDIVHCNQVLYRQIKTKQNE